MSWRGVKKSLSRFPHQFKTRNGGDDVTQDTEFTDLESRYKEIANNSHDFRVQVVAFRDHLSGMLDHQWQSGTYLAEIFGQPFTNNSHARPVNDIPPETMQAVEDYATAMEYCQDETKVILEEFDARVVRPTDQFQMIIKTIDKTIIKRQHRLLDYDRHKVSYIKYSAIKEPSPSEERNLSKLQAQYESAAQDYEYFNNMLKNDLLTFLDLAFDLIHPLVENFYNIQSRFMGGIYGRLYEVIQHNSSALPTWNMSVDEGYRYRLSQVNASEDLGRLDILKKGFKSWERGNTSSSLADRSSSYSKTTYTDDTKMSIRQGYSNIAGSHSDTNASTFGSRDKDNRSYSSHYDNDRLSEYNYNEPPHGHPIYQKPSLSPNSSFTTQTPINLNKQIKSTPPPLAKKPLLSQYSSFKNVVKTPPTPPPSIPRGSKSISTANQLESNTFLNQTYTHDVCQQRDQLTATGYQQQQASRSPSIASSSSYHSANIMTPPAAVIESRALLPSSSPFSDEQQVMIKKKRAPPPPPPPRGSTKKKIFVEALYDFNPPQDGDLSFSVGDCIEIIEKSDSSDDWWKGRIGTQVGMFPANYVRQI